MSLKKTLALSLLSIAGLFSAALIALPSTAQGADVLKDVCSRKPKASVCRDNNPNSGNNNPLYGSNGIITQAVNIISLLVGIAAVVMIIMAGLKFVTSGSNPQEVTKAREMVIYAVIGLILVATAQILVRFVLNEIFKPPA